MSVAKPDLCCPSTESEPKTELAVIETAAFFGREMNELPKTLWIRRAKSPSANCDADKSSLELPNTVDAEPPLKF